MTQSVKEILRTFQFIGSFLSISTINHVNYDLNINVKIMATNIYDFDNSNWLLL